PLRSVDRQSRERDTGGTRRRRSLPRGGRQIARTGAHNAIARDPPGIGRFRTALRPPRGSFRPALALEDLSLPTAWVMALVPLPPAVNRTIRARQTCFCGLLRSRTIVSNRTRSAEVTVMDIPLRIAPGSHKAAPWAIIYGSLPSDAIH